MSNEQPEQKQEYTLPPFPQNLLPLTEDEEKLYSSISDSDSPEEIRLNASKKLYALWVLWGNVVNCEALIDLINEVDEDKTTKLHQAKSYIVQIIDQVSKILTPGHILKEIQTLQNTL